MNSEMLAETPLSNETTLNDTSSVPAQTGIEGGATLRDCVEKTLSNYFAQLDGAPVKDVYQLVLSEVEAPLLEQVLKYTRNNQTKASELLGLNRGTLRKKLKQYGLL